MDADAKRLLRRELRRVRREVGDQDVRSVAIADHLASMPAVAEASVVMLFDAVPGEPHLGALADVLAARGVRVVRPEPAPTAPPPIDPAMVDVAIVPGVAFTADGRRLGQGGGWYDRFLSGLRPDATAIGVCFAVQVVGDLPVEPHDVRVDVVVTEHGAAEAGERAER